jgi:hypothetical protein
LMKGLKKLEKRLNCQRVLKMWMCRVICVL